MLQDLKNATTAQSSKYMPLQIAEYVWKATHQSITLFKRAETNPTMLKLSSVAVQSERPAITGIRERFTNTLELSPVIQT